MLNTANRDKRITEEQKHKEKDENLEHQKEKLLKEIEILKRDLDYSNQLDRDAENNKSILSKLYENGIIDNKGNSI